VRVGVYVAHLVNFLWCVFFGGSMLLILLVFCDVLVLGMSILLILLVFCVVFFLGVRVCVFVAHLVNFLWCFFGGIYVTHLVSFL
jgi:hypothetical protein